MPSPECRRAIDRNEYHVINFEDTPGALECDPLLRVVAESEWRRTSPLLQTGSTMPFPAVLPDARKAARFVRSYWLSPLRKARPCSGASLFRIGSAFCLASPIVSACCFWSAVRFRAGILSVRARIPGARTELSVCRWPERRFTCGSATMIPRAIDQSTAKDHQPTQAGKNRKHYATNSPAAVQCRVGGTPVTAQHTFGRLGQSPEALVALRIQNP